jgi:hypothetical protein
MTLVSVSNKKNKLKKSDILGKKKKQSYASRGTHRFLNIFKIDLMLDFQMPENSPDL